jgi:hypothetical protein
LQQLLHAGRGISPQVTDHVTVRVHGQPIMSPFGRGPVRSSSASQAFNISTVR